MVDDSLIKGINVCWVLIAVTIAPKLILQGNSSNNRNTTKESVENILSKECNLDNPDYPISNRDGQDPEHGMIEKNTSGYS